MYNPMNRPPVGGTDWAAGHILRLLKEQAAARAERNRPTEVGFRPSPAAGGEAPGPLDWLVDPVAAAQPAVPHPAALARMRLAQGAPSASWGINRTGSGPANTTPSETIDTLALLASLTPVVGDIVGLANDGRHYWNEPESRNWRNYALSGLGLMPWVPPMAASITRGSKWGLWEDVAEILRAGEIGDVNFGRLAPKKLAALSTIRRGLGPPELDQNLVIPANVVRKLLGKRMAEGQLTADKMADVLISAFHGAKSKAVRTDHPHIQALVNARSIRSNVGFVGQNSRTGETVVKSAYPKGTSDIAKRLNRKK
jgi:hypothetical protein